MEILKKVREFLENLKTQKNKTKYLDGLVNKSKRIDNIFNDSKFVQHNNGKNYKIHEVESFVDLENGIGTTVRAAKAGEAGDVIAISGKYARKSIDNIGVYNDIETISRWAVDETEMIELFLKSIDKHFRKISFPNIHNTTTAPLDFVALDFRHIDAVSSQLRNKVLKHINKPDYKYKDYVKSHLIKLNF